MLEGKKKKSRVEKRKLCRSDTTLHRKNEIGGGGGGRRGGDKDRIERRKHEDRESPSRSKKKGALIWAGRTLK